MVGGEHSLKITAPKLLWFGIDSVLKILNERINDSCLYKLINHKGVYRTDPAKPGLLITSPCLKFVTIVAVCIVIV